MKTLRNFGLVLMTILLSVNLTSCSDDDDPSKNPEKLVGEWILIQEKSWDSEEGDDGPYYYDFNNPKAGSSKIIIKATDEKDVYELENYYYSVYNSEWKFEGTDRMRLDGKKAIYLGDDADIESVNISLSGDKMTVTGSYEEAGYKATMEMIYQKKN